MNKKWIITLSIALIIAVGILSRSSLSAEPDVKLELNTDGFIGEYFQPKKPSNTTVVILGGGEFGAHWGREFAKQGHSALSLPYHRQSGLPSQIEEIPLEYFEKANDWLESKNEPSRIIVMGASTNAELALLLAAIFPSKTSGAIAICPSSVTWSNQVFPWSSDQQMAKWTYNKAPLPYLPMEKIKGGNSKLLNTLAYWNGGLNNSQKAEFAAIEVEKIKGAILLITPEDDQVWPSYRMSKMIEERMKIKGKSELLENCIYPDAGHLISAQYVKSFTSQNGQLEIDGRVYSYKFGGTLLGNLSAQYKSRAKILSFVESFE